MEGIEEIFFQKEKNFFQKIEPSGTKQLALLRSKRQQAMPLAGLWAICFKNALGFRNDSKNLNENPCCAASVGGDSPGLLALNYGLLAFMGRNEQQSQ